MTRIVGKWSAAALLMLLLTGRGIGAPVGDSSHGGELYEQRCGACHSLDASRVGPMHRGVYGRKAGSVADFQYSNEVKNSNVVWNEETLNQWLTNPEAFIPGQQMNYQVPDAQDRADIIAYLKKESADRPAAK